ncbi:MAG: phage portal protein [Dehalococcoidia bacterium]|jgi:SPP1 gp7 family putative phage head morphogenesis protein|nr:phage portal protein [Dehalococcoidia bacterium]
MRGFIATALEDGFARAVASTLRRPAEKATVIPDWMQSSQPWRDWSVQTAINEGLRSHWVVWRAFTLKARMFSSVPWVVRRPGHGGDVETVTDPNHRLVKFLHSPNPYQTWTKILYLDSLYADTAGDYVLYHSNAGGDAVWPLRVENILIQATSLLGRSYTYLVGGQETVYAQDEVVHIQQVDIGSEVYGLGTIRAAGKAVDTGNAVQTAQAKSMQQVVRPSGLLSGDMGKDVYDALKADIAANKAGAENVGKLLIARSTLKFQPFMLTPAEVDFIQSLGLSNDAICAACEVDPCLIGLKDTTYENKRAAEVFLWNTVTIPRLRDTRDTWNMQFVPRLGLSDGSYLDFDLSRTPAVVEAIKSAAETARIFATNLHISPRAINERLGLGFSAEDVSEQAYIQATMIPLGSDSVFDTDGESVSIGGRSRMVNLSDKNAIGAFWRAKDGEKKAFERAIAARVRELFQDEEKRVLAAFTKGKLDLDSEIDEGRVAYERAIKAVSLSVIEHFGDAVDKPIPERSVRFNVGAPNILRFLSKYVAEQITAVFDSTKREVRKIVAAGLQENVPTDDIARSLKGKYREWYGESGVAFDTSRAFTIARTEVHSLAGFAQHEAAAQSGVLLFKEWVSSLDARTRDSHAAMNGEVRPMDEPYSNGLMAPGDPDGDAGEIINCRCNEIYHTEKP